MIRLLTKEEALVHLLTLSPEDRYTRFCSAANDDYIRGYVEREVGFFYGFVRPLLPEDSVNQYGNKQLYIATAVIHVVFNINTKTLEVAVSTLPQEKGKGLAKKLMFFAHGLAEAYNADKIIVSGLSVNSPMIQLAKSCGYNVKSSYGEFEGEISTIGTDVRTIAENNIKIFKILLGVAE